MFSMNTGAIQLMLGRASNLDKRFSERILTQASGAWKTHLLLNCEWIFTAVSQAVVIILLAT